ncbi:hypothetical protein KEC57_03625 [Microbacterium sp. BWT-G7]|uniref:CHY-type domain-containing protein n=1 Tax=Microbacterium allomyrinae TaxID=2830666 RepID=A0A9X1LSP3_9MICO|nr:hypothetical protein [Microbacterium allomyrinae]
MRPRVLGAVVDAETRCIHYATPLDVVALRFHCCGEFYPCHRCHAEAADHPDEQWPAGTGHERAVLCGPCGHVLSIAEYARAMACPSCAAPFNPGCKLHWELYFSTALRGQWEE